jgi:hypothetical protein
VPVEDTGDGDQADFVRYAARKIRVALSTTSAMRSADGADAA